jgi:cytochrome c-type biogenesis protein CcmH/NrfG
VAVPAAIGLVVLSLVAFVPPWLSARLTSRGQLHWAKRLDPLSVDPYIQQGTVRALEEAVRKQPRDVELRFDLGLAYQRAGELRRARAELLVAKRLDPREPRIQDTLKRLPKRPIRSS